MTRTSVTRLACLTALWCACGSKGGSPPSTVAISVTPSTVSMLTCTQEQLTATVTGASNTGVTWNATGGGSVDGNGLYSAPMSVPSPASATVVATSKQDPSKSARATIALSTALPQTMAMAGTANDDYMFHHLVAASGKHVYAALKTVGGGISLAVAASTDGGLTFGAPVKADDVPDATILLDSPAIAVDAGDPNTVYVVYTLGEGPISRTGDPPPAGAIGGQTVALAVSTDGAKTFKNYVIDTFPSGYSEFSDVASPAPGVVTVEAPLASGGGGHNPANAWFRTYVDTNKGAGFANGVVPHDQFASSNGVPFNVLYWNGGSGGGGEAPMLFGDGHGKLCLTYGGGYNTGDGDGKIRVAVQCSKDNGVTFGAPVDLEYESPHGDGTTETIHQPLGAFSPTGQIAVTWWRLDGSLHTTVRIAQSSDGGATFSKPTIVPQYAPAGVYNPTLSWQLQWSGIVWQGATLWLVYNVSGGNTLRRIVVDKSCDGGMTWSGAQLVNGPEGNIGYDALAPGIALSDTAPVVFSRIDAGNSDEPFQVTRLAP